MYAAITRPFDDLPASIQPVALARLLRLLPAGDRRRVLGRTLAAVGARRPDLDEWGLAGRKFGTLVTWFLIGGDLYTAYTVIAVPAALFGAGAIGFFAIPYCIISYPIMMLVLPPLWRICHSNGYITLADYVRGRYQSRWLSVAVAVTGILATMPYIALQLIGMREVIAALGVRGEWPLIAAFVILAAYTYSSGLRAPALIAIVKDVMLYIMVLAAVLIIPAAAGRLRTCLRGGFLYTGPALAAGFDHPAPCAVHELLLACPGIGAWRLCFIRTPSPARSARAATA